MEDKKKITINMIASLICFAINMGINFFLSPYIIKNIGTEAYGFVSLANNFVNYATIITVALNSMAGRYITIAIHKNKEEDASKYFTSVLIANIIIILILIVPAIAIITRLEKFLNIGATLISDVKILFTIIFFNFFVTIIDSTYSIATFATNNLYLKSIKTVESYIIKVGTLIVMFILFKPAVFYVGVATLIASIFILISDIYYTIKLLPNIKVKKQYFSWKKVKTLIISGIWNTITKLGQLLTDGLDLILCNLMINDTAMGQLAIAKTIASVFSSLLATISNIFQPDLTILYAKRKIRELVVNLKRAMKISGFFANIPLAFIIAFGPYFFQLWTPTENSHVLTVLTILTIQGVIVSGAITPMYAIYTITNKIKTDAILRIVLGVINILIVYILLKNTNLGIYAIAGVSTTVGTIFNVFFVPMYTSHCLRIKKSAFYPVLIKYILTTFLIIILLLGLNKLIIPTNWIELIISGMLSLIIGVTINYFALLNKHERKYLLEIILKRLMNKNKK